MTIFIRTLLSVLICVNATAGTIEAKDPEFFAAVSHLKARQEHLLTGRGVAALSLVASLPLVATSHYNFYKFMLEELKTGAKTPLKRLYVSGALSAVAITIMGGALAFNVSRNTSPSLSKAKRLRQALSPKEFLILRQYENFLNALPEEQYQLASDHQELRDYIVALYHWDLTDRSASPPVR